MDVALSARTAVVFPGMASSTFADVGRFMMLNPYARRRAAAAGEVLGYPVLERLRESEEDYAEVARAAFVVNSMALADLAEARWGMAPDVCVGASFGQHAAAVYTGALSYADSLLLAVEIGRIEQEYFTGPGPDVVTHSFTRVPARPLAEILAELTERGAWHEISAYLDDGFHMVSLPRAEAGWFTDRIREVGGYSLYTVWPPVHAGIFAPLRARIEEELIPRMSFAAPRLPVLSDQDGSLVDTAEGMRALLLDGVVRPIRWPGVVAALEGAGVAEVHVPGPENLFARLKSMTRTFTVTAVTPKAAAKPVHG